MECIIEQMQDDDTGVPVRTVKSFMSKIPSVFTGECSIYLRVFILIVASVRKSRIISTSRINAMHVS